MKNRLSQAEELKKDLESLKFDKKHNCIDFCEDSSINTIEEYAIEWWDYDDSRVTDVSAEYVPLKHGFQQKVAETFTMWDESALRVEYPEAARGAQYAEFPFYAEWPFTCKVILPEEDEE
jgi:hypothetical protein